MPDIQDRYEVQPVGAVFVIRDMAMRAFCSLDGRNVLEWPERLLAEVWLHKCYSVWGHNPNITEHPNDRQAAKRNKRYNPRISPWDQAWYDN